MRCLKEWQLDLFSLIWKGVLIMPTDRTTFAQYEAVLKELGFQKRVLESLHVRYEHAPSGTVLLVRPHQPSDSVPDYVLVSTRSHLSYRGLIEPAEFEAMLHAVAA